MDQVESEYLYNLAMRTHIPLADLERCVLDVAPMRGVSTIDVINEVFKNNSLYRLDDELTDSILVSDDSERVWEFDCGDKTEKYVKTVMILYDPIVHGDIESIFGHTSRYLSENERTTVKMRKVLQDTVNNEFRHFDRHIEGIDAYYQENKSVKSTRTTRGGKGSGGRGSQETRVHGYIAKIEIRDNKIFEPEGIIGDEWLRAVWRSRGQAMIDLISRVLETFTLGKDITLYIFLGDYMITDEYPILGFAKPISEKGILMPDWTFVDAYKSAVDKNWDAQIEKISTECSKVKYADKKDCCFFQGANTSKGPHKSNIRGYFQTMSSQEDDVEVLLDYPIPSAATNWCHYKFLLDMPGAYPWSVRLKELFLTQSLVLKVDLCNPWINFYSDLFVPGQDYIRVNYNDNKVGLPAPRGENPPKEAYAAFANMKDVMKTLSKDDYLSITRSAYSKAIALNSSMVRFYVRCLLEKYASYFYE